MLHQSCINQGNSTYCVASVKQNIVPHCAAVVSTEASQQDSHGLSVEQEVFLHGDCMFSMRVCVPDDPIMFL